MTLRSGKLYVLILPERSPLPTWSFLSLDILSRCSSFSLSSILARSIRKAFVLFLSCDLSSWQVTIIPEGRWVILTAESVVFTLCPPGPDDLYTSIFKSLGSIFTSTSSASGRTATVAAEVWILPWASVRGTLWTLCIPLSYLIFLNTSLPSTENIISLNPPIPVGLEFITSIFQPCFWAYLLYILNRSPANKAASSPPVPGLISTIIFLLVSGSFSVSNSSIWRINSFSFSLKVFISSSARAVKSLSCFSFFKSSSIFRSSSFTFLYSLYVLMSSRYPARSFAYSLYLATSLITSGSASSLSNSSYLELIDSNFSNTLRHYLPLLRTFS